MSRKQLKAKLLVLVLGWGSAGAGLTQGVPFDGQITPAQPFVLRTFEIDEVLVTPVATGLANPFDMAFRGNGDILVTERYTGKLRVVRDGRLLDGDLSGLPEVYSEVFRAGLMAVEVHPDDDRIVYLTYTKPIIVDGEAEQTVALLRARIVEDRLVDVVEIFAARGLDRGIAASQLLFTPEGKLLMSVGGAYVYAGVGDYAQDPALHYGKLLRLNDDGSAPTDNPFVAGGEYLPEVYTVGHRNIIGLSHHPETGELWATENGPQGGDAVAGHGINRCGQIAAKFSCGYGFHVGRGSISIATLRSRDRRSRCPYSETLPYYALSP